MSKFTDAFEANTPKDFHNLMCGWPDAEYGINFDAYIDHYKDKLDDLCEGEAPPTILDYEDWKREQREEDEERENLGFSWETCDLCGALPGDRHAVTAFNADMSDYIPLQVCGDCCCYIANGDEPED